MPIVEQIRQLDGVGSVTVGKYRPTGSARQGGLMLRRVQRKESGLMLVVRRGALHQVVYVNTPVPDQLESRIRTLFTR